MLAHTPHLTLFDLRPLSNCLSPQVLSDRSSLLMALAASLLAYALLPLTSLLARISAAIVSALGVLVYAAFAWPPSSQTSVARRRGE